MRERGRLQEGMVADIVVFDPETVSDNARYTVGENATPSTGIPYVLVNGAIVVNDSNVVDGVQAGQPIRFEIEREGRFEPIARASYLESLLGPAVDATDELGTATQRAADRGAPLE